MATLILRLASDDGGQALVEYAAILSLVSIVAVAALAGIGGDVQSMVQDAAQGL
jgi:Flp pilus assembly pilin Flp